MSARTAQAAYKASAIATRWVPNLIGDAHPLEVVHGAVHRIFILPSLGMQFSRMVRCECWNHPNFAPDRLDLLEVVGQLNPIDVLPRWCPAVDTADRVGC